MSRRVRIALHLALFLIGAGGTAWLVDHVGARQLANAMQQTFPWIVLIVLLEGGRWVTDAMATQELLMASAEPGEAPRAPTPLLLRAQWMAYPIVLLFPAGRLAGEALKAAHIGPHVGYDRAAAAAIFSQALPLIGGFVISLPCIVVAALRLGVAHPLTLGIAVQTATAIGLAVVIIAAARRKEIGTALARMSSKVGATAESVGVRVRRIGWPVASIGLAVVNRMFLAAEVIGLAMLIAAVPWDDGVMVFGAHLVGAAAGDVVPAQVGATDGALALAASSLHLSLENAVAIALCFHATQLLWALGGGVSALFATTAPPHAPS